MKIALVHDWLTCMRGGEKCLESFCEIFPHADLYTLIHTKGMCTRTIENMNIITSFLDKVPGKDRFYRHMLPILPVAIEQFILKDYDLIFSSSHCVAKGIIPGPNTLHVSYTHSPMRYVWDMYEDYFKGHRFGRIVEGVAPFAATYLRAWDVASSERVDYFLANSHHVAKRIQKYYRREAKVIHPPVDTSQFELGQERGDYYLIVSAFTPYKRIDLAIDAFNHLGYKLKIAGRGEQETTLKRMAGPNIEFLGWKFGADLADLYSKCKAFVFPGEEDFGITPLEAMVSGKPVIAYGKGGALETVKGLEEKDPTGVFFYNQSKDNLIHAINEFEGQLERFNPVKIRQHASKWNKDRFKKEITNAIEEAQSICKVKDKGSRIFRVV